MSTQKLKANAKKLWQVQYDKETKDSATMYFTVDTQRFYLGENLIADVSKGYTKTEVDNLFAGLDTGGFSVYHMPPPPKTWGVKGLTGSTPQLERTHDNEGNTWSWQGSSFGSVINTSFDTEFNFERITDANGNIFVRIPTIYRRVVLDDGGALDGFDISFSKGSEEFLPYPCFVNAEGETLPYVDIGAYKGSVINDRLTSRSGFGFTDSKTIGEFRSYAEANTEENYIYHQHDLWVMQLLCDLQMIVFATRQCGDYMGTSWKEFNGSLICGDTNGLTNPNVEVPINCCAKASGLGGFKFFGIEDYVGYAYEWVDGIYFDKTSIYVSYNPREYADSTTDKTRISYDRSTAFGENIKEMRYGSDNPFVQYPTSTSGNSNTSYYCDDTYYSDSGTVLYMGARSLYSDGGLFYRFGYYSASFSNQTLGSRLCRRPTN